ncbi:MAG: hypothetical protein JF591_17460, partial [Lysobacter sp.]|nr:hypothetical protein [Lysobacter sp.]
MELRDLIWWFAGLAPGLLLGWWLGARKRPATTQVEATATPSPPQPQRPPAPAQAAPAATPVAPATPAPEAAPAAHAAEPPAPAVPVWSPDVQALF